PAPPPTFPYTTLFRSMTETATAATYSTVEEHKFGTVGKAFRGVEVKIADDGEILVKGPNIFQGYYKNDDASFGAVVDGWLHTGEIGRAHVGTPVTSLS